MASSSKPFEPRSMGAVRDRLADVSLILTAVFGMLAVGGSMIRAMELGWVPTMGLHLGFYAVILLMTFQRRRIPVFIKSGIILSGLYIIGTASFPVMGSVGSGLFFYMVAVVIGVLLFGFRTGLGMMILCLVTLWVFFLGGRYGLYQPDIDFNSYVMSSPAWITKITLFTMLSSLILGIMMLMERWLNRSMTQMVNEIEDRKNAELELEDALAEKDTLLREIHHRVKSNLQVVTGLLEIQLTRSLDSESEGILRDSRNRIQTMSIIHEELHRSRDLSRIRFDGFLDRVVTNLHDLYTRKDKLVSIVKDFDEVHLVIDTAIPCGLIVNELVTNSLKHAFPGDRAGEIKVSFKQVGEGGYLLMVSDNGIGLPEGFDISQTETLGMQLVVSIANQLGASIERPEGQGTSISMNFKEYHEAGTELY